MNMFNSFQTKSLLLIPLFALLAFACPGSSHANPIATLENIEGEVFIHRLDAPADLWEPISETLTLNNGDGIKTEDGTCVLVYGDQGTFTMHEDTQVTLKEEPDSLDLWLSLGSLRAEVNSQNVIKPFQIATPTAVSAIRGTIVNFSINESYELVIENVEGDVFVYNDEVNLELDLFGGQTIGIFYDPVNTYFIVENSANSTGDVMFSVYDPNTGKYTTYTATVGEVVYINFETGEFRKEPLGYDELVPREGFTEPPSGLSPV